MKSFILTLSIVLLFKETAYSSETNISNLKHDPEMSSDESEKLVDEFCSLVRRSNLNSYNCKGTASKNSSLIELMRDESVAAFKENSYSKQVQSDFRNMAIKFNNYILAIPHSDLPMNQLKINCDEVNEQYTICNGNKYIRDTKNIENLKRDTKNIEHYIESGKVNNGEAVNGKSK